MRRRRAAASVGPPEVEEARDGTDGARPLRRSAARDRGGGRRGPAPAHHQAADARVRRARASQPAHRGRRRRPADGPGPGGRRVLRHHARPGRAARRARRDDRAAAGGDRRGTGARRHAHQPVRRETGLLRARRRGPALRPADLLRRGPRGLPAHHLLGGAALRRVGAPLRDPGGRRVRGDARDRPPAPRAGHRGRRAAGVRRPHAHRRPAGRVRRVVRRRLPVHEGLRRQGHGPDQRRLPARWGPGRAVRPRRPG